MSDQYQPTEYYDWPAREHGYFLHNPVNKHYEFTSYDYVPYEYYGGDEIHGDNVVFRQSEYVTYDLTHIRMVNRSDIHMYDTSGISIFDSGMLTLYTSAAPSARKFVVDQYGRVGIGMDHHGPHGGTDRAGLLTNRGEEPSFDLDVRGQVGVEDYIYHNDNTETYMLFGSDLSAHDVNVAGEIHTHYPDDQDEINFRVGGVDMMQMQTRDVFYAESGTTATGVQDHITFNKYQSDVDFIVRSVDEPNMLFVDSKNNRVSIGDSEDAPKATLEVKNHPSSGAYNVPLVQLNNKDTDKQLLDINAENITADVISVSAHRLVTADVMTVTADNLTIGDVYNVTADSLTTGSIYHATTTSSSREQVSLFHLESTGDRGHDINQTVLMDLNFDTTAGRGARAFRIDSEQTTGKVVEIDAQRITSGIAMTVSATDLTTGKGFELGFDNRTTGTGMHIVDTSGVDATGALVKIEQTGDRSGFQNSTGIDINYDTTNNPNSRTIKIDTEQRDGTVVEVDATPLTTGKALHIHNDSRTTGEIVHLHDASIADSAGALVKIEQDGDRSGTQASHVVNINMDTTNNPNSRTIKIDTEQRDGTVIEVDATPLTTGKGLHIHTDSRTTGEVVHLHDAGTADTAGALVKIEQDGDRSGTAASIGIDVNFDTTNNPNSRTLRIDSEQRDGTVVEVDATPLTTGKGIYLHTDNRSSGTGLHIHDASTVDSIGALVRIEQDGDRSGTQASHAVNINMDTTNNPNSRTIFIDTEQRDGIVLDVDATEITTGIVVQLDADKLTSGTGVELNMFSRTTGTGLHIHDRSIADSQGVLVKIEQDGDRSGTAASHVVDINMDTTNNPNSRTIKIDTEQRDGTVIEVDATEITSGRVLAIDADGLTGGKGIELLMGTRTSGTGLHVYDSHGSDHAGDLIKFEQVGDRSGNQTSRLLHLNLDTTNNPNSRALHIDSEQRDGTAVEVDVTPLTTGKGLHIHTDSRTTGEVVHIHDAGTADSAGALVKIEQDGDRSGTQASVGIDVNFDTTNNPNSRVLRIDSEQRDGTIIEVDASPLTTGKGLHMHMNNRTTGTGVHVTDTSTTNTPGALMKLEQLGDRGGDQSNILLDLNVDTTNNPNSRTIRIDSEQKNGTIIEVDATPLTTGKALHIHTDTRTSGELIHLHDAGTSNTAGAMVKIEQDGDRSGTAATHVVDINMDTTNNPNSRTIKIDTEQRDGTVIEVDATEITTGRVLAIDADKLTSGKGIELLMDTRTTGTGLHIHDDAATDHAGNLVLIEQKGDRSGTQASRGVYLNFDTTNNPNSRAFIIDSEQRDGIVMELDASPLTTGKGIYLHTDNRTTGTGLHIVDDSGTDSAGRLVHIEQKGNRDGTQTSIGMEINFDTTANVNARALKIDSEQTTGKIFEIDGDKITSGTLFDMRSIDSITTGKVLDIHSNSASTSYRDLIFVHNDNTAATGVRALYVLNDAKADRDGTANVRGETVRFETTAADTNPLLELRNSNAATNTPPILNFIRSASNEADDMSIGTITFEGKDSGNIDTVYAAISARATDKDNTTEAGEVSILVQATDSPSTLRNLLRIGKQENSGTTQQAEVVINEDQIDCDFRVETNTSNNALVVRGDGSEIVINENSRADHDFRVESNNSNRMFFVDTSLDYVEIKGPANDDTIIFDIIGNSNTGSAGASLFRVSPTDIVFNESSNDVNFRIEADTTDPTQNTTDTGTDGGVQTHLTHNPSYAFFVDGSNGRVGLGTGTPSTTLHIAGSAHIEGDLWVKGNTNQIDTLVHVTSAMDITNKGTGPALTVTQNGAQPVAAFYDGNNAGSVQYPAFYIENGGESGPGNVGIGTTNPEYDLEILKTGRNDQNTQIAVTTHSTGTHTSDIILQKSRGSESSPVGVNDNDIFGRMVFQGWNNNANAWNTGAMIHARVHGDPHTGTDTSDMPGELVFSTTGDASNVATERMRIMHTGRIGIGSSATDPMNTVQIDHNGADYNNGLLIVRNDTTIVADEWLGGIGFDGKDGNVPSSITEAAAYIGAYATETWSTGDKGAKLVFGVAFNDDDDDTATNQPMEINNTGTVTIKNNHNGNTGLIIDNDHTTGNGTRTAMRIDMDISGNDDASADRYHYGLDIDVDSSYTGGNTSLEGRLYGARITSTNTGDNNYVYGAYILGQTSGTDANVATDTNYLYGAYIQADQNRATRNANQFGVFSISTTDNQGATDTVGITNSYGVFGKHYNNTGGVGGTTTAATGGYFHVECDEGAIGTATGVRSRVDRDVGTISTGYLFRGTFEGTIGNNSELTGTKWGIHIEGANRNAIEGHLQLGAVTAGSEKTYTTLYVDATDGIRVPVGTTDERPPNSSFGITATSPTDEQYLPKLGTIRYNTTQSTFEGFGAGNQWGSLGGVIDPDRDTYWTAVNDLDNLHNPGGTKYGTDEFDPETDYPGDVDYLRAFTSGIKRFAITDTGVSRWYYNNDGNGAVADPYTYQTKLQITTDSSGAWVENPTDKLYLEGQSGINFYHGDYVADGTTTPNIKRLVMNTTDKGIDVRVPNNSERAEVRIYGSGQSSGYLYVGQSLYHGGGIMYNGDDNPAEIAGGDQVVLYRRTTTGNPAVTTDHAVMWYSQSSNDVNYSGNLYIPATIYHSGDTNTYTTFGDDLWRVATGGEHGLTIDNDRAYLRRPLEMWADNSDPVLSLRSNSNGGGTTIYFSDQNQGETTTPTQSGAITYYHTDDVPDTDDTTVHWHNAFVFGGSETHSAFIFDTNTKAGGASGDTAIQKVIPSADQTGYIGTNEYTWRRGYFGNLYVDTNIYHIGDTNTSLTFGTDEIQLKTGNVSRLTLTNSYATFANDLSVPAKIVHSGDIDTYIGFTTDTITMAVSSVERFKVDGTGADLFGKLRFNTSGEGIRWTAHTDGAEIRFESTGDNQTTGDSKLVFETIDNGTEYFVWQTNNAGTATERMTLHKTASKLWVKGQIESGVTTGTAPFVVSSTTKVTNLNADYLDGWSQSDYRNATNLNSGTISDDRLPDSISSNITGNAATTTVTTNTDNANYNVVFHSDSSHLSNSHLYTNPNTQTLFSTGDIIAFASDARLKENVELIKDPIDKIKQISGYTYTFNDKGAEITGQDKTKSQVGVMAQEVEKVLPQVVTEAPGDSDYKTVKYDKLVPLLIESIKEQQSQIDTLKAEIEQLKSQ